MHSDLASRRRTADTPAKPEAGLAEWTSRIKELQRQVDADEEAETKRLEEEIAASRLARMQRNTGRSTSQDLSATDVAQSLRETSITPSPAGSREHRGQGQHDTLKKPVGESRSPGVSSHARSSNPASKSSTTSQPMSLAAFMGGRATGPRLNKHAPQQDSYDATQFDQRAITAPHPIFGRGGVALPGMAGRSRVAGRHEEEPQVKPVSTPSQDRRSTPAQESSSALRTLVQNAEERRKSISSKPTTTPPVDVPSARSRTTSTHSTVPVSSSTTPSWKRETLRDHSSPSTTTRPTTPGNQSSSHNLPRSGRHTPTRSTTPAQSSRNESASPLPPPRTPQSTSYSASPKSPTTSFTPGLAKPIQPTPRKSYGGPDIPLTQNPSATYLRTSPNKEPTPSISRLQGRGFVQSMVKASSQVESPTSYSSSSPSASPADKSRERKTSVLDRWQHNNDKPPPIIAPKPVPVRKSHTTGPSSHPASPTSPTFTPPPTKSIKPDYTGKSLKSVASLPSIAQAAASQVNSSRNGSAKSDVGSNRSSPSGQKRGLGSSTTMISYIKPLKTGDNPPTNGVPSRPASAAASRGRAAEVDELGLRVRSRSRSKARSTGGPEVGRLERQITGGGTGKPLSHPTKDRARKPRKAKTVTVVGQVPMKSETSSWKAGATMHRVDETTAASFDVKNLSAKQPGPLEVDVITAAKATRAEDDVPVSGTGRHVHFPLNIPASPPRTEKPHSPVRHTRIPSTGNRATVMEVAQALQAHGVQSKNTLQETEPFPELMHPSTVAGSDVGAARSDVKPMIANWGLPQSQPHAVEELTPQAPPPMERRKSNQEKYSAFSLPPLLEEKTPVHSPASTLSVTAGRSVLPVVSEVNIVDPGLDSTNLPKRADKAPHNDKLEKYEPRSLQPPTVVEDKLIHFHHDDDALPKVDVGALFHDANQLFTPDADITSISVEVLSVQGTSASPISRDSHVFYDGEILAIVHRFKSKSSGLVGTKVWAWRGNKGHLGEREERKLQELARRYNTSLITVHQYAEPPELVYALGGRLATRQGLRPHWSAENTAMHLVRLLNGVIYIDELELGINNLCSGFSYCLSFLETFYVWHGHASTGEERESALQYAQGLASSPENIIELVEGESDGDEMFWLILGEGDYAKADYWRYKPSMAFSPRAWRVKVDDTNKPTLVQCSLSGIPDLHSSVHILDCIWEIFVMVGSDARCHRKDIRLALSVADEYSAIAAPSRPFTPPVHVLVLPSQIPIDLRLAFRDLDESLWNKNSIPDHMNLLPSALAFEHLQRTSWNKEALSDADMLPLGLDPIA